MVGVVSIAAPATASAQSSEAIPITEIERGQHGYGVSVFEGSSTERFDVEVLGVLHNLNPGRSFILARLSGRDLESTGVIQGMSGSPVYIDQRLAGAVAFSWNFSEGAIAGITPIADMRALRSLPLETHDARPASALGDPQSLMALVAPTPAPAALRERLQSELGHLAGKLPLEGARSSLQFVASGFDEQGRNWLSQALGAVAPSGRASDAIAPADIVPGSSIAGVLVGGDLQLAASGTVTDRDGDELLAFGHPVFGFGPVSIPMASAEVLTVVPSRLSSFKLTNVGPVIGAFDEDRLAGSRGRVGAVAPTTALDISVAALAGAAGGADPTQRHDFRLQVADVPPMRPTLTAVATLQAIDAASYANGEQALDLEARFRFDGYDDLHIRQSFDGSGAALGAAIYVLQVVGFLELNPFVDVDTREIAIDVGLGREPRTEEILAAHAERKQVRAGESLDVILDLQGRGGRRSQQRLAVSVPADTPPGSLYVFVGDGASIDAARLQIEPVAPHGFEDSLRMLSSFHSRRDLGVLLVRVARGLVVDGRALPDLPDSMRALWQSGSATETKPLALAIVHRQFETRAQPLDGIERIDLQVLPPAAEVQR